MTDIPGTGKISPQQVPEEEREGVADKTFSIVNVKQIKSERVDKPEAKDNSRYNTLKYWVLFGSGASLLFLIIGLFKSEFFWLVPLGPIVAAAAWYIRKFLRRTNLGVNDELFK